MYICQTSSISFLFTTFRQQVIIPNQQSFTQLAQHSYRQYMTNIARNWPGDCGFCVTEEKEEQGKGMGVALVEDPRNKKSVTYRAYDT